MYKERFPNHRKSKLQPSGDCPFQVVDMINDNACKVDLPGEHGVNVTFNVADLTLFDIGLDSRSNPVKERGDDVDQLTNTNKNPLQLSNGPITRFKTNALKEALNGLVLQVSAKAEIIDPLENQEEAFVHLIHV